MLARRLRARCVLLRRLRPARTDSNCGDRRQRIGRGESRCANPCPPGTFDTAAAWFGEPAGQSRAKRTGLEALLPGVLPRALKGDILAGGLNGEEVALGVVLMCHPGASASSPLETSLLEALLDPLSGRS